MSGRHGRGRRGWHGTGGRIERFQVPALLLLLRERRAHGYDLLDRLPELTGEARVDVGNLYRVLRTLEQQGLVASEWDASVPGPAKRVYELTDAGAEALGRWAAALGKTRDRIDRFLRRHDERR
jgi:poly-beta-hydroxybutyrate-responsive repressor